MFRNLMILNAALVVFIAFGVHQVRSEWRAFNETHRVDQIQAEPETVKGVSPAANLAAATPEDWTAVSGRNPFTFDRNDQPIVIAGQTTEVATGPKPVLFGTMSLGKELLAMLGPPQGVNRGFKPMRKGETIDGWLILEIHDKSVVLQARDRKETILMNDPSAQVPRDYTRTIAASTAPTVSGGGGTGTTGTAGAPPSSGTISPAAEVQRPIPLDANGQPRKGRWLKTPFGDVFVEDRP